MSRVKTSSGKFGETSQSTSDKFDDWIPLATSAIGFFLPFNHTLTDCGKMTKNRSDAKAESKKQRGGSNRNAARMIEKEFECLCRAEPADFLVGLYPAVKELVSFVNTESQCKPEKSEKVFAVLARCISRIYTRIDSGGDIIDCALEHPIISDAGSGSYSYRATTAKMRKLRKNCLELTVERATTLLPETFRETTWLFCDACGKDQKNRWNLLCLYNDLIADMWGGAKALSGNEDTGESEV